jgi:hypothetical protein
MSPNPLGLARLTAGRPWLNPFLLLIPAAAAALLAVGLYGALPDRLIAVRVGLILAGLVLALAAAQRQLRQTGAEIEQRAVTAGYLALSSFVGLLCMLATDETEWDSFRLMIGVLVGLGLVGAVLVLLPTAVRRGLIVLAVLVHFGGILTAVFSVPPPNSEGCWLTNTLWTTFYRPYLQFMYLNNAYHFYSPDPGPPTLLWFRIQYADGTYRWVKIPNREDFHTRLEYQRRLALTESTNYLQAANPATFDQKLLARNLMANRAGMPIPLHPGMLPIYQYREPNGYSKKMLTAYARHVGTVPEYKHPEHPDTLITHVKIYRVIHNIISPQEMAKGVSSVDETLYWPFYMGEFVPGKEGVSVDLDKEWVLNDPHDPLLYWLIPIIREPKRQTGGFLTAPARQEQVLKDYLAVHAGDRKEPTPRP